MERLKRIPKPSQLDEWKFYEKLEAENIEKASGPAGYLDWSKAQDAEAKERNAWRLSQEFEVTLGGAFGQAWHPSEGGLAVAIEGRRRSSVMLEIPGRRGSRIKNPKEEPSPKEDSEA
jgi:hypothetical protein